MPAPSAAPALVARIAQFLGQYPPFSYLDAAQLATVARTAEVAYVPAQAAVFEQGEPARERFFVVHKGAIRLFRVDEGGQRLVDQLDEGDVFGIRPLIARQAYAVTARASEESLVYALRIADFEPVMEANPRVSRFLTESFAAGVRNPLKPHAPGRALIEAEAVGASEAAAPTPLGGANEQTRLRARRKPVHCKPSTSVRVAAVKMSREGVGSIVIVDEAGAPVGILTDRDMRRMVVTGLYPAEGPVEDVMSQPVVTIAADPPVMEVQFSMLRHRISHLVVTADGTPATKALGVLTNRDLLIALGNSPAAIVAEIYRAGDGATLRRLRARAEAWLRPVVEQRGSVYEVARIMTEINDQITRRAVTLALDGLRRDGQPAPTLAFCWLSLGSHARGEQLLRTDQDHAVLIADGPAEELEPARDFYAALGTRVADLLEEAGYERCVGDMMATNRDWCLSHAEWLRRLRAWIERPSGDHLLNAATLLDRRPLAGDLSLGKAFVDESRGLAQGESIFLAFLASAAVDNPPPLSFFRNFVVESSGEHKDSFDIKQRAMLSLADAARVLSLGAGTSDPPGTIDRYDRLRALEPRNADVYEAAAQAYDTLMLFRARQGLADDSDGRYFRIRELSKLERLQLRNTFTPINDLLSILKMRFQLQMISK